MVSNSGRTTNFSKEEKLQQKVAKIKLMLARGNEHFRAPGEHGFCFFQVEMFTGSVSVLLTSTSLKITLLKLAESTRETEHRGQCTQLPVELPVQKCSTLCWYSRIPTSQTLEPWWFSGQNVRSSMRKVASSILARGTKIFVAQGEHGFSFFQVEMFTVSVLLTSTSLK